MTTFSFLSPAITTALGWTLLHALWQGFALVLIAATAFYLLRYRSSYARYWVGIGTFLAQVLASVTTFALYYQPFIASSNVLTVTFPTPAMISGMTYTPVALPWYKQMLLFLQIHLDSIVLFWGIGASVLLVRLVGSWVYVQQLKAEGIQLTEPRVQALFRRIMGTLAIRQTVHLFESVRVHTPMVIGFLKPVVLLPVGLVTGLTTKQIEAILAHELAHVKRYDYLLNLLQSLVEVIYFFHPALWWLSGRVRQEREHCCDDIAIGICGDKLAFAHALAAVASYQQTPVLAMAFASQKGALLHRVRRILGVSSKSTTKNTSFDGVLLVVLLTLGVSVYAIQQEEKSKQKSNNTVKAAKKSLRKPQKEWAEVAPTQSLAPLAIVDVENAISPEAVLDAEPWVNDVFEVTLRDSIDQKIAFHSQKIDSLTRLMDPQHRKIDALHREMEQYNFKVEELERKMEVIDWKRNKFYEDRGQLIDKRSKSLHQEGQKIKKSEVEVEKELAQFEEQIKQQEAQIQQFNQQVAELRQQLQTARQPIEEIEKQIQKLEKINEQYSEEMNRHSMELSRAFPPPPPRVRAVRLPRAPTSPRAPMAGAAPKPAAPSKPTPPAQKKSAPVVPKQK
ncbi:MAG: M56 family metallopeptidase [Spirosomataceae bacterium]